MTPTESPAALLPCPFCGSDDLLCERADFTSAYILCNKCLVRGPEALQESDDEETPGEASARDQWNRRASTATAASESRGSVPDGFVLVPKDALDWLFGEAGIFECPPSSYFRGKPPAYWWRSEFRKRIAAPTPPAVASGEPTAEQWRSAIEACFCGSIDDAEWSRITALARSAAAKGEG